ncbi:HpcH/HpaI aldolase/citrate lyase family protein [Agaricicola taiwanensis]|nr:CoA ester lyase [Agaricicola taiwanensis]
MRSYLFVPGDDERKLIKSLNSGADALILDLEDAVAPDRKRLACEMVAEFVVAHRGTMAPPLFIRVNGLDTGLLIPDLAIVTRSAPVGIMLPKCSGAADVALVSGYLDALEVRDGVEPGSIRLFPIITEEARALAGSAGYHQAPRRLTAMLWGGEDLAADIGAFANRTPSGDYHFPFQMARAFCLFASAAAGVAAVDAVYTDFRDMAGLAAEAKVAAETGFSGKAAIHPAQVEVINRAFTPDAEAIQWAEAVLAAFAGKSASGVASLDGKMLDRPHLRLAERLIARAKPPVR